MSVGRVSQRDTEERIWPAKSLKVVMGESKNPASPPGQTSSSSIISYELDARITGSNSLAWVLSEAGLEDQNASTRTEVKEIILFLVSVHTVDFKITYPH